MNNTDNTDNTDNIDIEKNLKEKIHKKLEEKTRFLKVYFTDDEIKILKTYADNIGEAALLYIGTSNICLNCQAKTKYISAFQGFKKYCSTKCANSSVDRVEKIKKSQQNKTKEEIEESNKKRAKTRSTWDKDKIDSIYNNVKEKSRTTRRNNIDWDYRFRYAEPLFDVYSISFYSDIKLPFKCKECKLEFESYIHDGITPKCTICNKHSNEQEIIRVFHDDVKVINDRSLGLEIDVLFEYFGIEHNGVYWHSDKFKDKNYHLSKTELCEKNNIQLFHIFENEWNDKIKHNIWISLINNKLNKSKRIYARKCIIKELPSKESREFLNNNHLQGDSVASIRVGLYHDDELVSIMTFGKSRFNKKYEYEIIRMTNILNTTVIGGFSKMLKYFERTYNPKSLLSYANRRWSQGNVYEKNGFTFSHNSKPNMFWVKNGRLYSRHKFQKHRLKDIEGFIFDENISADKNMTINKYLKIYDSGNKVYFKRYD